MRNDFDYRTSAQHMDGVKGKANFNDFAKYERGAVKLHKQAGNGGQFSSNEDITTVTNNLVKDYRQGIQDQIAAAGKSNADPASQQVTRNEGPVTFSKEYAQSRAGEDAYKDFTAAGGYSALMRGEKGVAESFRQQRADNVKEYLKPDPVSQAGAGIDEQGDFRMKREFTNQRKAGQIFS